MSSTRVRATIASVALSAIMALSALLVSSRSAGAEEGWKYYITYFGGCSVNCTPAPEFGLHCPCYELPPIVIEA